MTITLEKLKDKLIQRERPKLLLDLDGVVIEYNFQKIVKDFFGVDLTKYQIYAYDLADVLGVAPMMINTMFKEQVFGKPNFVENSMEVLNELSPRYDIYIFSNRLKYMSYYELAMWLDEYDIPYDSIDETGSGNYFAHIDDSPAKLMSTNSLVKLLFNQPWNKSCWNITNRLKRVDSWEQIRKGLI